MDIHQWLKENCEITGTYSINENECVNVSGNVKIIKKITKILIKFRIVSGHFNCCCNQLTSLEGGPIEVGGYFSCFSNQLTSLKGGPIKVGSVFNCSYNQLTSLEGAPQKVGGDFNCHNNQLTSLKGAPKEIGDGFNCDDYLKDQYEYKWYVIKKFMKSINSN
jgi:hypothetical protein